jgi:hypothetical protein
MFSYTPEAKAMGLTVEPYQREIDDGVYLVWTPIYRDPKLIPGGSLVRGTEDVFRDERVRLRCDRCKTEKVYETEALITLATDAGMAGKHHVRLPG